MPTLQQVVSGLLGAIYVVNINHRHICPGKVVGSGDNGYAVTQQT